MPITRKRLPLFFVTITVVAITTGSVLGDKIQDVSPQGKANQKLSPLPDEDKWPVADYAATLPSDREKRVERQTKNARHDKSTLGVRGIAADPEKVRFISLITHWYEGLPAIPAKESDAIIVGDAIESHAYVSDDKSGVYSEFTFRSSEVLKTNGAPAFSAGNIVEAQRPGGRVRFPTQRVIWFRVHGQGVPEIGKRYLLFLKQDHQSQDIHLITAYELSNGLVFPLDKQIEIFNVYKGASEAEFLHTVRKAVAEP